MKYLIKFIDDGIEYHATIKRIKNFKGAAPSVGELVDCRFTDSKWYKAKVLQLLDTG